MSSEFFIMQDNRKRELTISGEVSIGEVLLSSDLNSYGIETPCPTGMHVRNSPSNEFKRERITVFGESPVISFKPKDILQLRVSLVPSSTARRYLVCKSTMDMANLHRTIMYSLCYKDNVRLSHKFALKQTKEKGLKLSAVFDKLGKTVRYEYGNMILVIQFLCLIIFRI